MESNDGKNKKNKGEKWKSNKSKRPSIENQMIETSSFMVHPDYLNKYGTLSNGVLTKSIKYAETWLYGTVGVRGGPSQRPSLFLYPGIVAPAPGLVSRSSYPTSPSGFVGVPALGYPVPDRGPKTIPRRIPDPRFTEPPTRPCNDCGKEVRSGNLCKKCVEKRTGASKSTTPNNRSFAGDSGTIRGRKIGASSDPYNLMRKSRLGEGETVRPSTFGSGLGRKKVRTASSSPTRRRNNEPPDFTFETFKPKQPEKEARPWRNDASDWINPEEEVVRRKSILECEIDAYELNKNGVRSKGEEDSAEELDDDFSADKNLKISRPKLFKTEFWKCDGEKVQVKNSKSQNERSSKSEVRLNGQRFKIFDHSSSSTAIVEGYLTDDDDDDRRTKPELSTMKPTFPKRPPRKAKTKVSAEIGLKHTKSKSKSSPNLSIKSILKKPATEDESGAGERSPREEDVLGAVAFFSENAPRIPAPASASAPAPAPAPASALPPSNQIQNTLKKKKQVQFRVNGPCELSDHERRSSSGELPDPEDLGPASAGIQRSKSCDDLPFASRHPASATASALEPAPLHLPLPPERSPTGDESLLKRSFSDRRLTSPPVLHKNDLFSSVASGSKERLFNDTMALRKRFPRSNAKEMFNDEKQTWTQIRNSEGKSSTNFSFKDSNSGKNSLKWFGNIISYAEFSDLIETRKGKENAYVKSFNEKPKFEQNSGNFTKVKSPGPEPPPRQSPSAKSSRFKNSASASASAKLLSEKKENESSDEVSAETIKVYTSAKAHTQSPFKADEEGKDCMTVVELSSSEPKASSAGNGRRASITIKNVAEEPSEQPRKKTSVIINNFYPEDDNKVRISVRNEPPETEANSSTCTIIETGSNSTVIPVVSTDNKTTLIVGSNTSMAIPIAVEQNLSTSSLPEETNKPPTPSSYIFATIDSETNKFFELMDPVEAVRRNLVPHICGKEENGLTLMEKIKQSRETKDQKNLKQISMLFAPLPAANEISCSVQSNQFLLASYKMKKENCKSPEPSLKFEGNSSGATSRSGSFCSTVTGSLKNSSGDTSRSSSFRSCCCKSLDYDHDDERVSPFSMARNKLYVLSDAEETSVQEKDKLECEYEIRNGYRDDKKEDAENIYETISEEPIYDKIESKGEDDASEEENDVPPPLPLSAPPSLDEIEKRSAKSIFEGASKYEILNYLVDAKERVKEESYFGGSSEGEDADARRPIFLVGTAEPPVDREIFCTTPSSADDEAPVSKGSETGNGENNSEVDFGSRTSHASQASYSSDDNFRVPAIPEKDVSKLARKSSAEIERNDSGVGSETSHSSRSKWQSSSSIREDPQHLCEDCDQIVETQVTDSGIMYAPLVCRKCSKRRSERKEIIQEIVETEEKYGRDLKIVLEEFYTPMLVAGLLAPDQLAAIFLNTEELLENSEQLTEKLRDALEIAVEQGDEDLQTVNVGRLFLEAGPMLHAFETYCTRQGAAAVLLANLEKEKELLRIFLRVSQMENAVLRRMNLNSFLMVPVQRVTKYPLLLARLYKVTPPHQEGRELLKEAQHNIELHLEHMNSEAKDVSATKVWRRFSTSTAIGRKSTAELEMINIKLRKLAVDVLDWNHEEVRFVMEGKLLYAQPTDSNWKRGRTIKLTPIFGLLATLGKPNSKYKMDPPEDELAFPAKTGIREATLLLVKEKCGRYTLIREPLYLDKIIVCCETDVDDYFELQELSTKDAFIFKAEDGERTKEWYRYLQYHAQILGGWRRRRNALANIMINGMTARAYAS